MQLMLIIGIAFAIGAVVFALQNNGLVVVTLALWSFEGSLAVVLLLALGLGALIAGLLSTPAVIRGQWACKRLRRQITDLESELAEERIRRQSLAVQRESVPAATVEPAKPYVGLRSLLAGDDEAN